MVTMTKMKDTTKDASCSGNNEFDEADDFIILIFYHQTSLRGPCL